MKFLQEFKSECKYKWKNVNNLQSRAIYEITITHCFTSLFPACMIYTYMHVLLWLSSTQLTSYFKRWEQSLRPYGKWWPVTILHDYVYLHKLQYIWLCQWGKQWRTSGVLLPWMRSHCDQSLRQTQQCLFYNTFNQISRFTSFPATEMADVQNQHSEQILGFNKGSRLKVASKTIKSQKVR